jgi:hypothetical protein
MVLSEPESEFYQVFSCGRLERDYINCSLARPGSLRITAVFGLIISYLIDQLASTAQT